MRFATSTFSSTTKETLNQIANEADHDDAINESEHQTSYSNTSAVEEKESLSIGDAESKRLVLSRLAVMLVLVSVATAVSVTVFMSSHNAEYDSFRLHFYDVASKLSVEFSGGASRRITAIEGLSSQITSYAKATNSQWPYVVLPDFERRVHYTMELSDVLSIIFFPLVATEERKSWEAFSVANQGWVQEGLDVQGIPVEEWDQENIDITEYTFGSTPGLNISNEIFRITSTTPEDEKGEGPYAPAWQFAPVFPAPSVVNFNGFSHPARMDPLRTMFQYGKPLLTGAWDYANKSDTSTVGKLAALRLFLQHGGHANRTYEDGPASDLYIAVYDTFEDNATVVGVLSAYVYWQVYFEQVLLSEDDGIIAVLENTCEQAYTYLVSGPEASYVGTGDLHDSRYDSMEVTTNFGAYVGYADDILDGRAGQCLYRLRIYPSREMEESFVTNDPRRFTLILASTFLFTCIVFIVYDCLVERRQKIVLSSAQKSGAVVASLFPKEVRDRLYEDKNQEKRNDKSYFFNDPSPPTVAPKLEDDCMAIADLYPECTVCFLDIVGFTQWSSEREPWQVFKLLETIYKTFDKAAKRLEVFKVETIGDCYVAATGLPRPQKDHAVVMARFAAECSLRIGRVTHFLLEQLGKDTADLSLRGGMHSGPVTAGVLRGAKARFQLFGDTVNTASRMETTGEATKVQVSRETGMLLMAAGKVDWVQPREEEIEAKGKGSLNTYWLEISTVDNSTSGHSESADTESGIGSRKMRFTSSTTSLSS